MDDTGRVVLVIGALLVVPVLVILLVTGSDDDQVFRRDIGADAAAEPTTSSAPSPAPTPSPTPTTATTPVAVEIEPTELPRLDGCEDGALLDEEARRTAFRDGLDAEGGDGGTSQATETWLATLTDDLSACARSLTADRAGLRGAMEDAVGGVDGYREALAAPGDNSVSAAWSDLEDALDEVIERWADTA